MRVTRCGDAPIITPQSSASIGDNINGPSLIKVPDWIKEPLGSYYLYFAHHDGRHIRLAFADDLSGPWKIHDAGVLPLAASGFAGHIASPDVHVDYDEKRIRMYFHGCEVGTGQSAPQYTRVATSDDGLNFDARNENLGLSYFRVFWFDGFYYALQMPGLLLRSTDPLTGFEAGPVLFESSTRHSAVAVIGKRLCVVYTRVGDAPERLMVSWIDLNGDWKSWRASEAQTVLKPERDYEGASQALDPSIRGLVEGPVNQLRDPAIFSQNGQSWIVYAIAGEHGLALAKIDDFNGQPEQS